MPRKKMAPPSKLDSCEPRPLPLPTGNLPGTQGKMEDLISRAKHRQGLFNHNDAEESFTHSKVAKDTRNGKPRLLGISADKDVFVADRGDGKKVAQSHNMMSKFRERSLFTPGGRIKWLRLKAGISIKQMSRRTGVSRMALVMIEADKRRPSLYTAIRLCDVLAVSLDHLVGRRDPSLVASQGGGQNPQVALCDPPLGVLPESILPPKVAQKGPLQGTGPDKIVTSCCTPPPGIK
jgi:transcriptional regulator with XRE-family HTH domain